MNRFRKIMTEKKYEKLEKMVHFSDRYLDKDGKPELAKIRAIRPSEQAEYQDNMTSSDKKGRNFKVKTGTYQMDVILNHTIEPDFRDADWLAAEGLGTPESLVDKYLDVGEATTLFNEIQKLSGLREEDEIDVVKEVKN